MLPCAVEGQEITAHHQPPSLPAAVETELERVIRRYIPDFHFEMA